MSDHRYVITAPWGDWAEADTHEGALLARRTLAADHREQGYGYGSTVETDIVIVDRGVRR